MPNVTITLNGKKYGIECGDGQEDRVQDLSNYIQDKITAVQNASDNLAENQVFALTALILTDELFEAKKTQGNDNQISDIDSESHTTVAEEKLTMVVKHITERVMDLTKEVEKL